MTIDKLPRYNLSEAGNLRNRLITNFEPFADQMINSEVLNELVENCLQFLPKRTPEFAVRDVLRTFVGRRVTALELRQAAWRIAGNSSTIAAGNVVTPVTSSTITGLGWVPVELLRMWPTRRGNHLFYELRVVALAGAAAGIEVDTLWPQKFIPIVASNLGFTPKYKKRPLDHPTELVGLWFFTTFKPNKNGDGVTIEGVKCSTVCQSHNRKLIDMRKRLEPCPKQYQHACFRCAVGQDRCIAATHRLTYLLKSCAMCGEKKPMDPECSDSICISCWQGRRTAAHG